MSLTVDELEKLLSQEMVRTRALEAEVERLRKEPFTELNLFLGGNRIDALKRDINEGVVLARLAADTLRRGRNTSLALRLEAHAKRYEKIGAYLRMKSEVKAVDDGVEVKDGG